ncbi:AbrB/MazE/SpoVT family DNA-binding domain-containing protein [Streptomyces sp. NPDC020731]|uniref:AbrB/MazE/SpoVT family DNA-binding domain-containing protein n=1 Tax=Streptomyces sp. NPDC020731 TaxID=3365085 RepID=UPI0037A59234
MTEGDQDIDDFNESAARAGESSGIPPAPSRDRLEPGSGFRTYRVSKAGQLTLPGSARKEWELKEGGPVHVAHIGDFVVIVRSGAWSHRLQQWRLEADLAEQLQEEIDREA